ncbi:ATP-binding protein [Undibacterium cyanobacteriorum]|uniref:histidine kinase n=1 Tax=Undibacterium cyanobacteriorum TaxID=3073561 RepID=A0ABY9RN21_9BURK|nr:ATP-binding protein [Undibacterium sp. 20NA77.5]WMW82080.1 ATP-binding protein [Undibacterium sp. 20NA77.5]
MEHRLKRLEAVQTMVLDIGRLSSRTSDIREFIQGIHLALSRIMYAANFYIALYNNEEQAVQFVYFVDEVDEAPNPQEQFKLDEPGYAFTKWVILNKKEMIITAEEDEKLVESPELSAVTGTRSEHWMGYPLLDHQKDCLGAMVIQSYDAQYLYTDEDQALFELIAGHVSNALQQFQSVDRLERAVSERTALLKHEISERKRSEQIQKALYSIAELSFSVEDADELYANIHGIVDGLITAKNFMVALYHDDTEEISVQYFVDEIDELPAMHRFPLGMGMTSFVIHSGKAQLIDQDRLKNLISSGEIKQVLGATTQSWIGVPILINDKIYGVIIVQSYDAQNRYTDHDLELLVFVASHIAVAIDRLNSEKNLHLAKANLEQQNTALNSALHALREAQSELVRKEKLASLGGLVAGVAHEINTPLGICVTATTHLIEELKLTRRDIEAGRFADVQRDQFLEIVDQSLRILNANTKRAASLVRSFKQVAVDQTSDEKRPFVLAAYLDEILISLQPKLKGKPIKVQVDCPSQLRILSHPGVFSQIITNFVVNSINHGFEHTSEGHISIQIRHENDFLHLDYQDDGRGMNEEELEKLFDPFFTTKRGQGGSGLGAHIVFNLVTGLLSGQIRATSEVGRGLHYQIRFPVTLA